VQARAESLPIADNAADAVMALLTVHHWTDLEAGAAELRRVARRRLVVLTWDQAVFGEFWLVNEYLPDVFWTTTPGPSRWTTSLRCSAGLTSNRYPYPTTAQTGSRRPTGVARRPTSTPSCAPVSPPWRRPAT
jgi:hypothetical protein